MDSSASYAGEVEHNACTLAVWARRSQPMRSAGQERLSAGPAAPAAGVSGAQVRGARAAEPVLARRPGDDAFPAAKTGWF